MSRGFSLRGRLTVSMLLVFALGLAAAATLFYVEVGSARADLRDRTLRSQARDLLASLHAGPDGRLAPRLSGSWADAYARPRSGFYFTLYDSAGRPVASSPDLAAPLPRLEVPPGETYGRLDFTGVEPDRLALVAARAPAGHTAVVGRGQPDPEMLAESVLLDEDYEYLYVLAPFVLLSLALVWPISGWSLRPVARASREAAAVGPANPAARITADRLPDEVRPLAEAVNAALDRLARAYVAERRLTADAAHELRTPLAVLSLRLQKARLGEADWPAIERDVTRLGRLVGQLMDLARRESPARGDVTPAELNLSRIVRQAAAQVLPLAEEAGRLLEVDAPDEVRVPGRADDLRDMMVNLLDNALVHGAGTISVAVRAARRACRRRGERRGARRARAAAGGGVRPLPQGARRLPRRRPGARDRAPGGARPRRGRPLPAGTRRTGGGGPADRQAARRGSTWPGAARIGRSGGRGGHAPITGTWIDTGGRGSRRPRSWMAEENTKHPMEVELKLRLPRGGPDRAGTAPGVPGPARDGAGGAARGHHLLRHARSRPGREGRHPSRQAERGPSRPDGQAARSRARRGRPARGMGVADRAGHARSRPARGDAGRRHRGRPGGQGARAGLRHRYPAHGPRAARRRDHHGRGRARRGDDHGRRRERGGERARARAAGRDARPALPPGPRPARDGASDDRPREQGRSRLPPADGAGAAREQGAGAWTWTAASACRRRSGRSWRRGSATSSPTSPPLPPATRRACTRCGSPSAGCVPPWCSSRRTSSRTRRRGSRPSSSASAGCSARPATGTSSAWTPCRRRWTTRRERAGSTCCGRPPRQSARRRIAGSRRRSGGRP